MFEIISKMDRAILELALIDAFYDACIFEGEEFTSCLIEYLDSVDKGESTGEQNVAFFEMTLPYVERSLYFYASTIHEGTKTEAVTGADKNDLQKIKTGGVGADVLTQMKDDSRETAKKELAESAILEGLVQDMIEAAKAGARKAVVKMLQTGDALADATKVGLETGVKQFKKNLAGFKIPVKTKSPNPAENKQ